MTKYPLFFAVDENPFKMVGFASTIEDCLSLIRKNLNQDISYIRYYYSNECRYWVFDFGSWNDYFYFYAPKSIEDSLD